jgi:hypothetical protein
VSQVDGLATAENSTAPVVPGAFETVTVWGVVRELAEKVRLDGLAATPPGLEPTGAIVKNTVESTVSRSGPMVAII